MSSSPIGFIGTGLLGLPMAHCLLAKGVPIVAYNRSPHKLESLKQAGAKIAESVADVFQECHAVILMVSDALAIQEVLFQESVVLGDRTVIQMGTISPSQSRALQKAIVAAGGDYLEAPVLGSIPEAESGTLQVMVGGSSEQFQQWQPLFQHLGENPRLIGAVGSAAALKLALNQLIASLTPAFALSIGFLQHQGVAVDPFMEILRNSALYAPTFDKKLQRLLDRNYDNPNFPTKHLLKDTKLFLEEAVASHLEAPNLEGVRQILEKACEQGLSDLDYSALFEAIDPAGDLSSDSHSSSASH